MSDTFNPYREWLGVDATEPSYYQLLGVAPTEQDPTSISHAADRARSRVRSARPGDQAVKWTQLLDELDQAKKCLLDPARRAEYDQRLTQAAAAPAKPSSSDPPRVAMQAPSVPQEGPPSLGNSQAQSPAPGSGTTAPYPMAPLSNSPPSGQSNLYPPAAPTTRQPTPPTGSPASYPPHAAGNGPAAMPNPPSATTSASSPAPTHPAHPHDPMAPMSMPPSSAGAGMSGPGGGPHAQPSMPTGTHAPNPMAPVSQPYNVPTVPAHGQQAPQYEAPQYGGTPNYGVSPGYAPPQHASPQDQYQQQYPGSHAASQAMYPASAAQGAIHAATPHAAAPQAVSPALSTAAAESTPQVQGATKSAARAAAERARRARQTYGVVAIGLLFILLMGGAVVYALGGFDNLLGGRAQEVAQGNRPSRSRTDNPSGSRTPANSDSRPPLASNTNIQTSNAPSGSPFAGTPTDNTPQAVPAPPQDPDIDPATPASETSPRPIVTDPSPNPSPPGSTPPETARPDPPTPEPSTPDPTPSPSNPAPAEPTMDPSMPEPTERPPISGESGLLGTPDPSFLPDPEGGTTPPKLTPAQLGELGRALTAARTQVGEMRISAAETSLDKAAPLAQSPEHKAKYDRLRRVVAYVKAFQEAVASALNTLSAGDTLQVGTSTEVGIVEAAPDHITVRLPGVNKRYTVEEMPIGLAVAVANHALVENTESKIIKAAYVLVNPGSTDDMREKAHAWWEEADQAGELGDLMLFLDDTYEFTK